MKSIFFLSFLAVALCQEAIQVGFLYSANSFVGSKARIAFQESVNDVNARYSEAGFPYFINPIFVDTTGNTRGAEGAMLTMIRSKVEIVVGPFSSSELIQVRPLANEHGITVISPTSTQIQSLAADDNIFRLSMPNTELAAATAGQISRDGVECIVSVGQNGNDNAREVANLVSEYFQSTSDPQGNAGQVLNSDELLFGGDSTHFKTLQRIQSLFSSNTKKCKSFGVFIAGRNEITNILARANVQKNIGLVQEANWYTSDEYANSRDIFSRNAAQEFAVKGSVGLTGFTYSGQSSTDKQDAAIEQIRQATNFLNPAILLSWDAAQLVGDMRIAGRAHLSGDWSSAIQAVAPYFNGITGNMALDSNGDRMSGSYIGYELMTVQDLSTGTLILWQKSIRASFTGGIQCYGDNNVNPTPIRIRSDQKNAKYCVHSIDYPVMANLPYGAEVQFPVDRDRFGHTVATFELCDSVCEKACDFVTRTCTGCSQFEVRLNEEESDEAGSAIWSDNADFTTQVVYVPRAPTSRKAQIHEIVVSGGVAELDNVASRTQTPKQLQFFYCNEGEACTESVTLPKFRDVCDQI